MNLVSNFSIYNFNALRSRIELTWILSAIFFIPNFNAPLGRIELTWISSVIFLFVTSLFVMNCSSVSKFFNPFHQSTHQDNQDYNYIEFRQQLGLVKHLIVFWQVYFQFHHEIIIWLGTICLCITYFGTTSWKSDHVINCTCQSSQSFAFISQKNY